MTNNKIQNNDLLIEVNVPVYDEETFVAFQRFHLVTFNGKLSQAPSWIVIIVTGIFCLMALIAYIKTGNMEYIIAAGTIFFCDAIWLCIYWIAPKISYKKSMASHLPETSHCYRFYRDHIIIETAGSALSETANFSYSLIAKAFETPDAFYLQLANKRTFFIIAKKNLLQEQTERLSGFLAHRFQNNYKKFK